MLWPDVYAALHKYTITAVTRSRCTACSVTLGVTVAAFWVALPILARDDCSAFPGYGGGGFHRVAALLGQLGVFIGTNLIRLNARPENS